MSLLRGMAARTLHLQSLQNSKYVEKWFLGSAFVDMLLLSSMSATLRYGIDTCMVGQNTLA